MLFLVQITCHHLQLSCCPTVRLTCAFIAAHFQQAARQNGVRHMWLNRCSGAAAQPGQCFIATKCPAAGGILALGPALTAQQLLDLNEAGLADEFAVQQAQEPLSFVALTDGGELALGNEQEPCPCAKSIARQLSWCIRHLWSQHKLVSPSEGLPCKWHLSVLCPAAESGPLLVQQQEVCKMQHPLS